MINRYDGGVCFFENYEFYFGNIGEFGKMGVVIFFLGFFVIKNIYLYKDIYYSSFCNSKRWRIIYLLIRNS